MYKLNKYGYIRLTDNAFIPNDSSNRDYQEVQRWITEGNTPEPEDIPNPNDVILAKIADIEEQTGVVRLVREGLLAFAEDKAEREAAALTAAGTPTTPEQLLAENIGYTRAKAVDDLIKSLRAQLK